MIQKFASTTAITLAGLTLALLATATTSQATLPLHLYFSPPQRASMVLVDEPYVFIGLVSGPSIRQTIAGSVENEITGARTQLPRLTCLPSAIGGAWLMFAFCDPRGGTLSNGDELYSLPTGEWRVLPHSQALIEQTQFGPEVVLEPNAIGASWEGLQEGCYHCAVAGAELYMNISTGAVSPDPSGPHTLANPNLPALAQHLCPPLKRPILSAGNLDEPGIVYGPATPMSGGYTVLTGAHASYLQRCGSHRRELLCKHCQPAVTSNLVLWRSSARELHGLRLPSRRRVSTRLPAKTAADIGSEEITLVLTARNVYLAGGERLYVSPLH